MNLKTRAAGIAATLSLGLALSTGIASAQVADTSATLDPVDNPVGCTLSLTGSTDIDFGTFTWDGDGAYTGTPTPGSVTVLVDTDGSPGERDCNAVLVTGTGLSLNSVEAFPASAISVGSVSGLSATQQEVIAANGNVPSGGASTPLTVTLDGSAINDDAPTGEYTGTITFELGNGLD